MDPQIWLNPISVPNPDGPVYSGKDAGNAGGKCSEAGTASQHFQMYCRNCDDIICNTFHSVATSPLKLTPMTFYPDFSSQSYCFVGIRIVTDSVAVRVVATSNSTEGSFYGRREITARKANPNDENYVDACMEFKCSGHVYHGKDITTDITKITVDVKDKEQYTCNVQKQAPDFIINSQSTMPLRFDDPLTYGERTGLQTDKRSPTEALCLNDIASPQSTDTDRCKIAGNFIVAATVTCS